MAITLIFKWLDQKCRINLNLHRFRGVQPANLVRSKKFHAIIDTYSSKRLQVCRTSSLLAICARFPYGHFTTPNFSTAIFTQFRSIDFP
jgi:hypothetical protein